MAAQREAAIAAEDELMICDFCSAPNPAWRYPAVSFFDLFGSRSVEDWMACDACHARIVAGDRDGLVARALKSPGVRAAMGVLGHALAIRYCRDLHERFWRARRGPPFRIAA